MQRANGADLYEDEAMRLLAVLASVVAVIGLATPAQADPTSDDASFLAALDKAGITYHNGADAVAVARHACDLMNQGQLQTDVIKSMTEENPGFTTSSATQFTAIAASAYCPQQLQQPPPPPATQPPPPPSAWFPDLPPLPAAL